MTGAPATERAANSLSLLEDRTVRLEMCRTHALKPLRWKHLIVLKQTFRRPSRRLVRAVAGKCIKMEESDFFWIEIYRSTKIIVDKKCGVRQDRNLFDCFSSQVAGLRDFLKAWAGQCVQKCGSSREKEGQSQSLFPSVGNDVVWTHLNPPWGR